MEFEFENDGDAEPGVFAHLITLAGLVTLFIWILILIF